MRFFQLCLCLCQLQFGVDPFSFSRLLFSFSRLLLAERFLCLSARFEELRAQAVDELEGVLEQILPVVERPGHNSAAAEEKILVVVAGTSFKGCR